jgi:drug/metabolite transporter (DMT)-like permease
MRRPIVLSGVQFGLLGFLCWSSHDVGMKTLLQTYPIYQLLSVTLGFACALTIIWSLATGTNKILRPKRWINPLIYTGFYLFNALTFFYLLPHIPLAELFVFILTVPIVTAFLAVALLRERATQALIGALIIGFTAAVIMIRPWDTANDHADYTQLVWVILFFHILGSALRGIFVRGMAANEPPLFMIIFTTASMAIGMGLYADWQAMDVRALGICLAVGFFIALGSLMQIRAFQLGPAAFVGAAQYTQIVWAALFGWLFFSEIPTFWTYIGAVMIIGSGWLLYLDDRKKGTMR